MNVQQSNYFQLTNIYSSLLILLTQFFILRLKPCFLNHFFYQYLYYSKFYRLRMVQCKVTSSSNFLVSIIQYLPAILSISCVLILLSTLTLISMPQSILMQVSYCLSSHLLYAMMYLHCSNASFIMSNISTKSTLEGKYLEVIHLCCLLQR